MIALILNSGMGKRMGELTKNNPKCLVEIKPGVTLFSHQVETLCSIGIERFVITTGYKADILKMYADKYLKGIKFEYVYNPFFYKTNYIVSLYYAREFTRDDIIMVHGDLYFTRDILEDIVLQAESSVVIDSTIPLPKKDFKAKLEDGKVVEISTENFGPDCVACQPLYKLNKEDWNCWQEAINAYCDSGYTGVYAENALNTVLERIGLYGFDIKGKTCMEIDDIKDLKQLRSILLNFDKRG